MIDTNTQLNRVIFMSEMASVTRRQIPRPEPWRFPTGAFVLGLLLFWPSLIFVFLDISKNRRAYDLALLEYHRGDDPEWSWEGYSSPDRRKERLANWVIFICLVLFLVAAFFGLPILLDSLSAIGQLPDLPADAAVGLTEHPVMIDEGLDSSVLLLPSSERIKP